MAKFFMNNPLRNTILSLIVLSIFIISCQSNQNNPDLNEKLVSDQKKKIINPEEKEIIATVEKLLIAAGNYNTEDLDDMIPDKTMLGISSLKDGDPAIGSDAISKVAQGFMSDLPDMIVRFESLVPKSNGSEFQWTLIATNSAPGGTGNKVKVSGYEFWQLEVNGLIKNSQGNFPTQEYNRQLEYGIDN